MVDNNSFRIKRGQAGNWRIDLNQDITNAIVYFVVKKNIDDSDSESIILKAITEHSDPKNGITNLVLTTTDTQNAETGSFYAEISIKNGDSTMYTDPFAFCIAPTVKDTIT